VPHQAVLTYSVLRRYYRNVRVLSTGLPLIAEYPSTSSLRKEYPSSASSLSTRVAPRYKQHPGGTRVLSAQRFATRDREKTCDCRSGGATAHVRHERYGPPLLSVAALHAWAPLECAWYYSASSMRSCHVAQGHGRVDARTLTLARHSLGSAQRRSLRVLRHTMLCGPRSADVAVVCWCLQHSCWAQTARAAR
jgi:hypothetical protein